MEWLKVFKGLISEPNRADVGENWFKTKGKKSAIDIRTQLTKLTDMIVDQEEFRKAQNVLLEEMFRLQEQIILQLKREIGLLADMTAEPKKKIIKRNNKRC